MASLYRQQLERWLKSINVKAKSVLDVGGAANPVKNRVGSWEVRDYIILDNDSEGPFDKETFITFDLNYPISETEGHHGAVVTALKGRADIVFCLEVSEYLFNPLIAIRNLYDFLKPGGILYISFCSIYPLHNPPKIDYLRYTKNAVEKLLREAGFKTWEIIPRVATSGQEALAKFYSLEQMRLMKGTNEIFDIGYLVKCFK